MDDFSTLRKELFTAVIGDVMDKMGLVHQFLPPDIRPLDPSMVVAGRAMPVLSADVFTERSPSPANPLMQKPFGLMLEALDNLRPDEVYVSSGAGPRSAQWGELMSVRARKLNCAGAVVNGFSRDTRAVLALKFPTFSFGPYAQDSGPRYKVIDYRTTIEIGGVRIRPGDIIYGDLDGVCVIPVEAEEEVLARALEKAHGERRVKKALEAGGSAVAAFEEFGIM